MRIGNLVKTAVKFAPIIVPIVKKYWIQENAPQQQHIHANKKLELINLSSNFFYIIVFISDTAI